MGTDMTDVIAVLLSLKSAVEAIAKVIMEKVIGNLVDKALPAREEQHQIPHAPNTDNAGDYALEVGGRIRYIRESLLGFSKRQMCEKLNIESVSQLEKYESGVEETPIHITRYIEQEFGVNPDYLDGGTQEVFVRFPINKSTMIDYLKLGFTPAIITVPRSIEAQGNLYCYITFEKYEAGLVKHVAGNLLCSFSSSGGGRLNIQTLIDAMLDLKLTPYGAKIMMATPFSWAAIENGIYSSKTSDRIGRFTDYDCLDIWVEWFEQTKVSRDKWDRVDQDTSTQFLLESQPSEV